MYAVQKNSYLPPALTHSPMLIMTTTLMTVIVTIMPHSQSVVPLTIITN